ncbi:PKD domain-containing protein [Microbulbifer sp. JTAC008]|uniref:PKD domain-containing protein n=1 Tax=unclassified Microbulbifer TaxID=2619833 RepID=UPI004039C735
MKLKLLSKFFVLPSITLLCASAVSGEVQFQPAEIYSTGSRAEAVAVADLNNDGRDDVVVSTSSNSDPENDFKLKIFLQDEYGQLLESIDYSLDGSNVNPPKSIAVGDLNDDGLQDVVVGFNGSRIDTFLQDLDGVFVLTDSFESSNSTRVAIADFDNDGKNDIFGIGWESYGLEVFRQAGEPFGYVRILNHLLMDSPGQFSVGDGNGDGTTDIAVITTSYPDNRLTLLPNDGQLGWNRFNSYDLTDDPQVGKDTQIAGISIVDLNSDGRNDIAVSVGESSEKSSLVIYSQGEDNLLQEPQIVATGNLSGEVRATDFDNNGSVDLLLLPRRGGSVKVYLLQNGESSEQMIEVDIPEGSYQNPQSVAIGDINGDGASDIVIANPSQGLIVLKANAENINREPTAIAGEAQSVGGNTAVLLDGTQSFDSDGSIVTYRWAQISGTPVALTSTVDGLASFVTPEEITGLVQKLVFHLEVEDDIGSINSDTITISVGENSEPLAVPSTHSMARPGDLIRLDGSRSFDLDGTIVSYRWKQTSGLPVEIEDLGDGIATFYAPIFANSVAFIESLGFELEVEDNGGVIGTSHTYVLVEGLIYPTADAGTAQTVTSGEEVLLDGRKSSDTDGDIVSYNWRSLSNVPVINYPNGTASFIAPTVSPGFKVGLLFEVEVEDNDGLKSTALVSVLVEKNRPPMIPQELIKGVQANSTVSLDASGAFDMDGEVVSYHWEQVSGPSVSIFNPDSVMATFTAPSENTSLVFSITLTDDDGESSTFNASIRVYDLTPTN